jgi:hypothetical protein
MNFTSVEPRIAIACSIIAVAVFLPAWSAMHHPGESYELGLAIAGVFAALGVFFGTIIIDATRWSLWIAAYYGLWFLFGTASCAALVFGLVITTNHWWQAALVVIILLQLAAMLLPVLTRQK